MLKFMHPDVVALWEKIKGRGHLCTLETCLVSLKILKTECTLFTHITVMSWNKH